jgi:hexulose-6-phosphate isomerase
MNRRTFLTSSTAAGLAASRASAARLPIRKGVLIGMLPRQMPYLDKFKLAVDCGWESIEAQTVANPKEAEEIKKASEDARIPIHSVMNMDHWKFPLSSPDREVVEKSLEGMRTSLRNAKLWGADTVLLVPAVVNPEVDYQAAWTRSQQEIRKLIPLAAELKIAIGLEMVWNKFLLSPLEFARYVDEFKNPWVRAYMDVGNMLFYGYPQHWIRTLGKRIRKVHLKDFAFRQGRTEWPNLGDGMVDWKAVHAALAEIGYKGDATVEIGSNHNAEYLKDLAARVEKFLMGG